MPITLRLIARFLAEEVDEYPEALNELLAVAAQHEQEFFLPAVLKGVSEGVKGLRQVRQPANWNRVASKRSDAQVELIRELSVVFGDGRAMDELKRIALAEGKEESDVRLAALETLIQSEPEDLREICEKLLADSHMNVLAARGLSKFNDPSIGKQIVARYRNFRGPFRPQIMSILVSRKAFAEAMLHAIQEGKIPRTDLSAFQVRQIHSFNDSELSDLASEAWGEVRDTSADKQHLIDALKQSLTTDQLSHANLPNGRRLFVQHCKNCHRLYGEGESVGPDLTGSNRNDLDYLLTNIVDPSSVVDKDYRMSILLTDDDRIVNGLVLDESEKTLTMQTATEKLTFPKDSIRSKKITEKSPMPDGLLENLSDQETLDLIGYLQHPSQVALPSASRSQDPDSN